MAQKPPAQVRPFVASFWVNAPTKEDLVVFVTGNCPELGNWDPDHAFPLNIIPDGEVVIPYRDPLTGFVQFFLHENFRRWSNYHFLEIEWFLILFIVLFV